MAVQGRGAWEVTALAPSRFHGDLRETLAPRQAYASTPSRVIPPGVDVERFAADPSAGQAIRERLGWPADACVAGFLGRFVPEKGLPLLLDALTACAVDWRALFVGGG